MTNKNRHNYYAYTTLLLCVILINLSILYLREKKSIKFVVSENMKLINYYNIANEEIKSLNISLKSSYIYEDFALNKDIKITDINNKVTTLKDLEKHLPLMVLYYSRLSCNICIESTINAIKIAKKEDPNFNFIVIASNSRIEDVIRIAKINEVPVFICDFPLNELILNKSYLFVLDKHFCIRNLFYIKDKNTTALNIYLNSFRKYFLEPIFK